MKKILIILSVLASTSAVFAQNNAGLGTTTPNASSILEMQSTTQGVLVPRMTAVQRLAITVNATTEGLLVYDLDSLCFFYHKAGVWTSLCNAGGAGPTGPTGVAGTAGSTGTNGINGFSCWDTNSNGVNDLSEDINLDGNWDGLDCQGAAGAAGPTGAAGTNGTNGTNGATGPAGTNGATGAAGTNGTNGATGAAGTNGVTGPTGATGATGFGIGPTGPTGATGTNGANGATGATGVAGANGATGATGAAGTNGTNGTNGATGATGAAGTNGATGATGAAGTNGTNGATGATGAAGTNGTNGATGATGAAGTNGTNGATGATGAAGTNGATGATGAAGANGATGATGAAGTNGTNGTNGATGATGAAGTNGATGATGAAGANGATGATGAAGAAGANGATGATGVAGAAGATGAAGAVGATGAAGAAGATGPTGPTWTLTTPTINADGTMTVNGSLGSGGPVTTTTAAWICSPNTAGTNSLLATGFLGTTSNNHMDLVSNNIVRGRLSNLGEFFIGTTNTVLLGDLMNGVGNVTFPWALNGYTAFNGAGTYGQVTGGTTLFAGVQGEYYGTNGQGAGVRGLIGNTTAGTSFAASCNGVSGSGSIAAASAGTYKFGVYGSGGFSIRSGGVMGYDFGIALGGLGYYASNLVDYSVYGFGGAYQIGVAAGRLAGQNSFGAGATENWDGQANTNIGIGIYGGVMGGWVRGMAYGMHVKGVRYSLYVDGTSYTNAPTMRLHDKQDGSTARVITYSNQSMTSDVTSRGKSQLSNGEVFVPFDANFSAIIGDPTDLVITVTPTGNSNGVYVSSVDATGFYVKENNSGVTSVQFSWIAVASVAADQGLEHPEEVIANDFDLKMRGVMFNDNNTDGSQQSIWWDGTQIRFDTPPFKPGAIITDDASRAAGGQITTPSIQRNSGLQRR